MSEPLPELSGRFRWAFLLMASRISLIAFAPLGPGSISVPLSGCSPPQDSTFESLDDLVASWRRPRQPGLCPMTPTAEDPSPEGTWATSCFHVSPGHRDGGTDPTELLKSAQPGIHRPNGACNTTHIMPPSRIWVGCRRFVSAVERCSTVYQDEPSTRLHDRTLDSLEVEGGH